MVSMKTHAFLPLGGDPKSLVTSKQHGLLWELGDQLDKSTGLIATPWYCGTDINLINQTARANQYSFKSNVKISKEEYMISNSWGSEFSWF